MLKWMLGAALLAMGGAGMAPGGEPDLTAVRKATERFRDVKVALAEGYIRDPMDLCETAEMMGRPAALGAMGMHYFRPDLLGITAPPNPRVNGNGTHTDFRKPAILIYEPQADGRCNWWRWRTSSSRPRGSRRARRAADLPRRGIGPHGGRSGDRRRRGAHVRAALRPARLALPRQSERCVRAVQPESDMRAPQARPRRAADDRRWRWTR